MNRNLTKVLDQSPVPVSGGSLAPKHILERLVFQVKELGFASVTIFTNLVCIRPEFLYAYLSKYEYVFPCFLHKREHTRYTDDMMTFCLWVP